MRVVVLIVVACGCRVATSSAVDPVVVGGDGLPDRIIVDAAFWSDLVIADRVAERVPPVDSGAVSDAAAAPGDGAAAGVDAALDVSPGQPCALLGAAACVGDEGCYPYPFEARTPTLTLCGFATGGLSIPCQSQLQCDELTLCTAPGEPESVCSQRCNLANPRCPTGLNCFPYFSYPGVGVCR